MGIFDIFFKSDKGENRVTPAISYNFNTALIECPYCFGKFTHDKVHFKAATVFTYDEIKAKERSASESEENDVLEYETQRMRLFMKSNDEIYSRYWSDYPENELQWEEAMNPVISPEATEMYTGKYQCDNDGFVNSVYDSLGKITYDRICPHCHNPLPQAYGKYPIRFITTVGVSGSGKTVFLSQLIKRFKQYMSMVDLTAYVRSENNTDFVKKYPIKNGTILPEGTKPGIITEPLFYDIKDRRNNYYTLVFYDIAGENCTKPKQMRKFGPFIKNADALILLLDPDQFMELQDNDNYDEDKPEPDQVLEAMYNSFGVDSTEKSDVPLALTFSKSDKVKALGILSNESNIIKPVSRTENKCFNYKEYYYVAGEIKQLLRAKLNKGEELRSMAEKSFKNVGYCMFTAIECGVNVDENGKSSPIGDPIPVRLEEPLLWILYELGIIDSEENRK